MLFVVFWIWPRVIFGWEVKRALGRTGTDVTVLGFGTCLVMLGSVLRPTRGGRWTAPLRWLVLFVGRPYRPRCAAECFQSGGNNYTGSKDCG